MVDESENLTFEIEVIIKYSAFSDQKFIFKVVLHFLFLCVITAQFELTVEKRSMYTKTIRSPNISIVHNDKM